MSTPALSVRGLSLRYGGVVALDDVDLDVAPGERVGIIGPNGAGKTTLLDAVSGFADAQGAIHVAGRDISRLSPARRARVGLGRGFQDARLFPTLTTAEVLEVAATRRSAIGLGHVAALVWSPTVVRAQRAARASAARWIDELGLDDYRDTPVGELSTGTRRIVELAVLLAREPVLVLLDEPAAGLAQAEVEALGPLLRRVAESSGAAFVVVEHDVPLVASFAQRLVAMDAGRVLAQGPPEDVLADERVLEAYLGRRPEAVRRSRRS